MEGQKLRAAALSLACVYLSLALAATRAYFVEPKTATSGWTPEDEYVGQSFIANVDSLLYAEWFVAELSQSGRYKFEIREQGTGRLVGSGDTTMPVHGWQWIRCDNWTLGDRSFVKGREYLLKVYHSTGDSVNYVVRTDNPYSYGLMMVPGQNPPIPLTWDLCARVYGEMRPCPAQYWGTVPELQYVPAELRGTWLARAESARIGWAHIPIYWDSTQTDSGGAFDFSRLDTELPYIRDSAGCQIHANVTLCPTWASSRLDGSHYCPPRNLWAAGDANWWAVFLDTLVRHCDAIGCSLHEISIWNEENDTGPPSSGITGWFRHPDTIFYPGVDTGLRGLCSLYVRMVAVAAATIHSIPGHASDRISLGGLFRSTASARHLVSGVDWLRTCYDIAGDSVPWDVVSVHPYQDWAVMFSSSTLEADASALRAVMDSCGHGGAELWNIEFGVDAEHCSEERFAAGMFEMYAVSRGSEALPEGGYDRACWFYFWWPSLWGSWGMVRSDGTPTAGFYAFKQMTQALTGLRCNGRVMAGDSRDDSVRMYEFEDTTTLKRTWVCWKNGGQGQNEVDVKLPVRSDSLAGEALDYTGSPPIPLLSTGLDGWLPLALDERPVFVSEAGDTLRPDLATDSVWTVPANPVQGQPLMLWAKLVNNGDSTRTGIPILGCPNTVVRFYANDSLVADIEYSPSIAHDETVRVSTNWTPVIRGYSLVKATVNEDQAYVELGLDDNAGFRRYYIPRPPDGTVDVVMPPGGMTNVPVVVFRLSSASLEKDSTGNTPADSARLIQEFFGRSDTTVQDADTTEWFGFVADTSWQFMFGLGRYRYFLQVKDSWSESGLIADTVDSVVVFDTSAAVGSFVINSGARFARDTVCTLDICVTDSVSGAYRMRFGTHRLANVVRNSGFDADDGTWEYSGGQLDNSLKMAELPVVSGRLSGVIQYIAPESLIAYVGDSCRLQADIAVHVHDTLVQPTGLASFKYFYVRSDTSQHDTSWAGLAEIEFTDSLQSRTGLANLEALFLMPVPAPPDTSWGWRGAVVGIGVAGPGGVSGRVWADNVKVEPCAPMRDFSWWQAHDTSEVWGLETGDGLKAVYASFQDSAGVENPVPMADSIILDMTYPCPYINLPQPGAYVSDTVDITGWAYDPITAPPDTFFESYRLSFRHVDSTNWLPVQPDSVSYSPVYPDSTSPISMARHLGYWATESLPDGEYWLMLTARDSAGNELGQLVWVVIDNSGGDDGSGDGPGGGGTGMGEGSIYIGSATGNVLHLSDELATIESFSVSDSGSAAYVTAILEVPNDSILVLDARNRRIHKLHKSGQSRRRFVSSLTLPIALTKDGNGNFWLCDRGTHRIGKFRSNGTFVFTRGGPGPDSTNLDSPEAIAVKGSLVYVADSRNDRVALWDTSGNYQGSITGSFREPTAVLVTDSGAIYVTDGSDGKLKGITPRGGNLLTISGANGRHLKRLVASESRHHLFTLAPQQNVVYKYRIQSDDSLPGGQQSGATLNLPKFLTLNQPFPNPARTRLTISYAVPRKTRLTLKLYDIAGKLVTTLANGEQKPGYYNLVWNRQDSKGRSVAAGVYFCALAAEGKRFTRKVVLTE